MKIAVVDWSGVQVQNLEYQHVFREWYAQVEGCRMMVPAKVLGYLQQRADSYFRHEVFLRSLRPSAD